MAVVADVDNWPEKLELERWLMTTVKEADPGVAFLRQVLQMNPAYGSYLSEDKDISSIVQMFAKRVRARCVASQGAMQPHMLYEPLCEMSWRVVGSVLHSIIDLQDENCPIPKEPLGQVKMLMQTNMELSRNLNNMRRDYLRELSIYRDEKRIISEEAQKTLSGLQEQPIMFFEPLKFVLDETTKDFVRACVEERVKLEQKTPMLRKVDLGDSSADRDALNAEIADLQAELRKTREALQAEKEARKKLEQSEKQLKQEVEDLKNSLARSAGAADGEELQALRDELEKAKALIAELQAALDSSGDEKVAALQKTIKKLQQELAELKEKAAQLEKDNQDLLEEILRLEEELGEDGGNRRGKKGDNAKGDADGKKKGVKETVVDEDELESLRKQLKKSLKVEKELRDANEELEKALDDLRKSRSLTSNGGEDMATKTGKGDGGKAARAALEAAEEEFRKEKKALKSEIAQLKELVEELQNADPNVKIKKVHSGDWQSKYDAVAAERDELLQQLDDLKQQVAILLQKLQKYGGDAAVREVQAAIKLTPSSSFRKKKADNVFERLYKDAERRLGNIQDAVDKANKEQRAMIHFYQKKAMNPRSAKILENLKHLQQAAAATQNRFMDAAATFESGHLEEVFDVGIDPGFHPRRRTKEIEPEEGPDQVRYAPYNLSDPDQVRYAYNKLHLENQVLQTEISDLREQLVAMPSAPSPGMCIQEPPTERMCIQGCALVATPAAGRGDLALGGGRDRSESGSPNMRRTPSPHRLMPYLPPHERPLPRPEIQRSQTTLKSPEPPQDAPPPQPRRELPPADSRPVFAQLTATKSGFRRSASDTQVRSTHDFDNALHTSSSHDMMGNTLPASGSHQRPPPIQTQLDADPLLQFKSGSRSSTEPLANLSFPKSAGKAKEPLAALVSHPGSMSSLGASASVPMKPKTPETAASLAAHQMLAHAPEGASRTRRLASTPHEAMSPEGSVTLASATPLDLPTPPGHGLATSSQVLPPRSALASTRAGRSSSQVVGTAVRAPANLSAVMLEPLGSRIVSPRRLMTSPAAHQESSSNHSKSSPNLLASALPVRSMTATGGQRQNTRQGRFGPADWDSAPVKPLPNDMCVTALRSQEWISGHN